MKIMWALFVEIVAMTEISKHEKRLFRVMVIGTALSFGILAAIMVSMKGFFGGSGDFEFSYKTVLAFFLGCLAGWAFWWLVRRWMRQADQNRKL